MDYQRLNPRERKISYLEDIRQFHRGQATLRFDNRPWSYTGKVFFVDKSRPQQLAKLNGREGYHLLTNNGVIFMPLKEIMGVNPHSSIITMHGGSR